jgi:NADH:ubiquinone oxidoreductase subunit 4 (subunit M)
MNDILIGAVAMASLITGLFFLRFWRSTRDRFFLYFAISFLIEGLNGGLLRPGLQGDGIEQSLFYALRLVAYGLILVAIWGKNKRPR